MLTLGLCWFRGDLTKSGFSFWGCGYSTLISSYWRSMPILELSSISSIQSWLFFLLELFPDFDREKPLLISCRELISLMSLFFWEFSCRLVSLISRCVWGPSLWFYICNISLIEILIDLSSATRTSQFMLSERLPPIRPCKFKLLIQYLFLLEIDPLLILDSKLFWAGLSFRN